jgi:rhodanese-related sulfurtransferase
MFGSILSRLTGGGAPGADEASHEQVVQASRAGAPRLVDVREPHEFAAGRIPGSINRPLSTFNPADLPQGEPVILLCQAGGRSANALAQCRRAGREGDRNYREGVSGWRGRGAQLSR